MQADLKIWMENIKAQAGVAKRNQQVPANIDTLMSPLPVRLKKFIENLPTEVRRQPQSLEFFRQGLRGRQGGKAHAGELGEALRKLGYSRKRGWLVAAKSFSALWYPLK